MRFIYNEELIRKLLRAVTGLTGISIDFLNPDGHSIFSGERVNEFCSRIQCSEEQRMRCDCSDKQLLDRSQKSGSYESHICYAGLYDAAIPMIKNGVLAGSVIMGQIRTSDSPEKPYITDDPELLALYENIPQFTDAQLEDLRILLPNILFESAIEVERDPLMDEIGDYIKRNLASELCLNDLCSQFHISKNTLYQRFRERYNCTVNSYITDCRIELAKTLLEQSDEPIYMVAEKTGFGNGTYFSKVFKTNTGYLPTQYRKSRNGQ